MRNVLFMQVFLVLTAKGQESFHVMLDKTICYPNDTIWIRGFVFDKNEPGNLSSSLCVKEYNDSSKLLSSARFPMFEGVSAGQIVTPKKPGLYWLRFTTPNAISPKYISLTVRDSGSKVVIRRIVEERLAYDHSFVPGINFNAAYSAERGLWCGGTVDSISPYDSAHLTLCVTYYGDSLFKCLTTTHKGRQFVLKIDANSIPRFVNGFVTLRYYNADTLLTELHVFIKQQYEPAISLARDKDSFMLELPASNWNYSVSVVKTENMPNASNIFDCLDYGNHCRVPDSVLSFEFQAVKDNKTEKAFRNKDVVLHFNKDSIQVIKLVRTDSSGMIQFNISPFLGYAHIAFKRNGSNSGIKFFPVDEGEKLALPDSSSFNMDTLTVPPIQPDDVEFDNTYLKPVIVTPRWQDRDKTIDNRFTSGEFANPTQYHWNIMKEDLTYQYDIWSFLKERYGGLTYNGFGEPPKYNYRYITFYVDERLTNYQNIPTNLEGIAYIKILPDPPDDRMIRMISDIPMTDTPIVFPDPNKPHKPGTPPPPLFDDHGDHHPVAMICIYTRRTDADYSMNPTELNTITVKGYDRPSPWTKKDRTTVLWAPFETSRIFKFKVPSSRPMKLVAEGVNHFGQVFHFEKVLE